MLFRFCLCLESNKKVKGDSFRLSRWALGVVSLLVGQTLNAHLVGCVLRDAGGKTNPPKLRPKFGYRLFLLCELIIIWILSYQQTISFENICYCHAHESLISLKLKLFNLSLA